MVSDNSSRTELEVLNASPRILIVDDSESDRLSYVRYLRSDSACSYRIIEAETLEEGLKLWRSPFPDLVLTDIALPDGSGLELLEAIGKTDPSLKCPVIVMTGQGDERLAVQAMKLGASDYLVKDDITASTFCHYVETVINQWKLSGKLTELQQVNQKLQELQTKLEERTHALEISESFNRSILETIPDLLLRLRRDGTCLSYIPPKVYKDNYEPISQHISEFLPPDLLERQLQAIEQALVTGQLQVYEHQVLKNNQIAHEEIRILAINAQEALVIVRDISSRKQAEQENLRFRERSQFLLASSPTIIYSCRPYGDYGATFMSENVEAILGYKSEEFVTQENFWASHIHTEDAPQIFAELPVLFEKGTHSHEYRFLHQDGHYLWIRDQLKLVKDDQGNPIEIVGSFSDISDHKQAEDALNTERLRLKLALDAAKMGTWSRNSKSDQLIWSERFQEIFGFVPGTFLGDNQTFFSMIHPEDRDLVMQAIAHTFATGEAYHLEYRIFRLDGEMRWITVWGLPSENLSTNEQQLIGIIADISDRKQTELENQQLLQELSTFKLALDRSAVVAITDAKGVINYANDLFCEISGYSRAELIGKTHRIVNSGYHPDYFFQNLWRTIRGGKIWRGEICNRKKNGDIYWLGSTMVPFLDNKGKPFQYLAIRFDITSRKQAELQLQNLTNRLSLALKSGAIGCWEWEIKTDTLTWDERMYELYGIPSQSHSALMFDHWINRLHPEDLDAKRTLIRQTAVGEAEFDTEFRVIHPDHSIHFIKAYGILLRDSENNPQRMIGVNFDITAQKQAEKNIRQQIAKETLLRQITQNMRETLDLQRIFETACQEIRQFIQTDRVAIFKFYPDSSFEDGEFVTESLKEGFSSVLAIPIHDHCFGEEYAQRYAEGHFHVINDVLNSDLQDCHKALLSQFEIRANLVMPLLPGKELWGLLCIHTCTAPRVWQADEIDLIQQISRQLAIAVQQADLFEKLQQEQQKLTQSNQALAHSNDDLARATRLKDEFLANMSHELRTPLNAILGMSQSLQENDLNQRQKNAVKLIDKSGRHLLDLINDILDLAKIEAGKLELNFSSASVNVICENSTILVKQMAFSKNIQLHTRIAENIGQIWVDERRIRQVLINLLSNAIKFTPSDGQVTLAVELEESEIVFSVTDTGIGITPENLNKLFQPFVQIDSNLSRQYTGTGLGLALVQRIVTGHGGTVSVTSTFGEGSCFALRLPHTPSSSVGNSLPENAEVRTTLTNITYSPSSPMPLILIADDNEGNIQTMEDYLGNKGYRILLAYNGLEAVEMTKLHKPDLILMDIQMPFLDGLQATAQIRSDPAIANIPIIALTALALPGDGDRCFAAGVNEYLAKPVRFKLLIEMIQKLYQNQESS